MSRSVLERLGDPTVVALRVAGEAWPRGLLSGTVVPEGWLGLVERPDGRRRCVPAGDDPRPQREDRLLLVRHRAVEVPLSVNCVRAACGHEVSAAGEVRLHWPARDADLAALGRTLLADVELTRDGLARAVGEAGGWAAIQQFIRQRPAQQLVHDNLLDDFAALLRARLERFLFSSGAVLERVTGIRFSCPAMEEAEALQRAAAARVEQIKAQELVQQAAVAAVQRRLEGLSGIFEKLRAAAAGDERLRWHDLLPALSPAERCRLLENLWRITPDRQVAEAVVVILGDQCAWLDPAQPERITRRVTLPDELGGLRSVQFCPRRRWLLVGAARGVWALDAGGGEIVQRYVVPGAGPARTGFNAAVTVGERLLATHSQLGCWCWPLGSPLDCRAVLRPTDGVPRTIRGVTALSDDRVALAADNRVRIFTVTGEEADFPGLLTGTIHCLAALEPWLYAGVEDGSLYAFELGGPDVWVRQYRAAGVFESIQPRRWNDLIELVIPGGAEGLLGVFPGEALVARLLESPVPIRRAWSCDDLLVGLSDVRDRLVVLSSAAAGRAGQNVPLARLTGHSIQDACLVVRPARGATGNQVGEDS